MGTERCRTHFERGNWALFDKESPPTEEAATPKSRLTGLYLFYTAAFMKFTLPTNADRARIRQRLIYAKSVDAARFQELADYYLGSGRIMSLWREVFSVRNSFINRYNFIQPLIMVRYWKEEHQEPVRLTDERFNELRQLYIDCFETLCRLLVLAMGYEMIFDSKDSGTVSRVVDYTEFCEKALELFAAFELAVRYHHDLHIYVDGRFGPT